jgi:hypothetical protein
MGTMGFNVVFKGLNVFLLGGYMPTETEDKQHMGCDFFFCFRVLQQIKPSFISIQVQYK